MNTLSAADTELLLHLAGSLDNPATDAAIERALRRQPDWDGILRLAHWHGISPLVGRTIGRFPAELIPGPVRKQLEARTRHAADRHEVHARELLRIIDRFSTRGIRAISFKGPTLVEHVYSGSALRESTDLDILIAPDEFPLATESLQTLGYTAALKLSACEAEDCLRTGSELPFVDAAGRVVDLHVGLGPCWLPAPFDHDFLWPRAIEVPLDAGGVRSMNDEDLLLYLCYHGGKSLWVRLKWLCDIDWLVSTGRVNWEQVERRAVAHGCWRNVALGLLLASERLGAPVPASIILRAKVDRTVRYYARYIARQWSKIDSDQGRFRALLLSGLMDKASCRIRRFVELLFVPNAVDLGCVALPRGLSFLYYVLRFFRLSWKHTAGQLLEKKAVAPQRRPCPQGGGITPESMIVRSGEFSKFRDGGLLVIASLADARSFALDEPAARVWELLAKPMRVSTACAQVRGERPEEQTMELLRQLAEERAIRLV